MIHAGGCHCGAVRYAIDAPLDDVAHCHCSICRKTSGGIVTTWATVPHDSFSWVRGEAAVYPSSGHSERFFCARCGALLALWTTRSKHTIDVTIATLDHPELCRATRHIWQRSRLPWLHLDEHLPGEPEETF